MIDPVWQWRRGEARVAVCLSARKRGRISLRWPRFTFYCQQNAFIAPTGDDALTVTRRMRLMPTG
ncbi:hypothetical protein [Burkholderia sp. Bp9143]|uniref:hypothetical protein n=1 Tax=Burkholderia sp. Bp9143 TaxID=2184574 RepID=UPI000F5976B2|nr:hypothetical protein [Burkholderia sp. Bp9143]